jgi:hypothetical protein
MNPHYNILENDCSVNVCPSSHWQLHRNRCPSVMSKLLCVRDDHIQNETMAAGDKFACHEEDWCPCITIPVFSTNNLLNP